MVLRYNLVSAKFTAFAEKVSAKTRKTYIVRSPTKIIYLPKTTRPTAACLPALISLRVATDQCVVTLGILSGVLLNTASASAA